MQLLLRIGLFSTLTTEQASFEQALKVDGLFGSIFCILLFSFSSKSWQINLLWILLSFVVPCLALH